MGIRRLEIRKRERKPDGVGKRGGRSSRMKGGRAAHHYSSSERTS